ncbi:MAG: hypothetical protein JO111_06000 [Caulobacteraceae bacterium]|nr:hypothetical protein [Caulobacteraceae bacterium]
MMAVATMVALAYTVIVPPGFMPARSPDGAGLAVVICTGHGPMQIGVAGDRQAPAQKSKAGAPCPFSATAAPPLPAPIALAHASATFAMAPSTTVDDQSPGRGLAAPPPPAIGPPSLV